MGSRRAIRRSATLAALVATVVSLVASAPAAANVDRYSNSLFFTDATFNEVPCNPSYAALRVGTGGILTARAPLFARGVASVFYFGIPVASAPFTVQQIGFGGGGTWGANWPVPSPSQVPSGVYTLNALLQGSTASVAFGPLGVLVFATVSDTARIAPGLNTDCSPIAGATSASVSRAAIREPSPRVLERRVQAMRGDSEKWFGR